jgi:AAA+ superfamily predicted ATPase
MQMQNEIKISIRAGCPAIYLVSSEESRMVEIIGQTAVKLHRKLWIHTISEGLTEVETNDRDPLWPVTRKKKPLQQYRDPIAVLQHIRKAMVKSSIYLLIDFDEVFSDALVRRHLKDLFRDLRKKANTIIFLSSALNLPVGLEQEICVFYYPLPSRNDIDRSLQSIERTILRRHIQHQLDGKTRDVLIENARGLTLHQFEDAMARALVRNGKMDIDAILAINQQKANAIRGSDCLEVINSPTKLDHVGGMGFFKGWLSKRKEVYSDKARNFGLPSPKGVLLLGVQGCGKSLAAKACGSVWGFPVLKMDTGGLFSSAVGSSEAKARDAIRMVESIAPCILWIDELEKSMAGIGSSGQSDAGTAARVFAAIASWLQERKTPVFVVATANSISGLPPEMIRKGRWDEIFFVDLPNLQERLDIFEIHLKSRNIETTGFNLELLAGAAAGFSGADIGQAVNDAMVEAFSEDRQLKECDLMACIRSQIPISKTMSEDIEAMRSWAKARIRFASQGISDDERNRWSHKNIRAL